MFESMVTSSPVIMEMYKFKCKCISSLVVSDFSSETMGSRFESNCELCVEVRSLQ